MPSIGFRPCTRRANGIRGRVLVSPQRDDVRGHTRGWAMLSTMVLWIGLGAVGAGDYHRPLGEKAFDQAALDAEGFGDKKVLAREADGLRVTLKPDEAEA